MMRENLGMLMVEQADGQVGIQLYADAKRAKELFDELSGKPEQKPHRATCVILDWQGKTIEAFTKDLPLIPDNPQNRPDGWRLGNGPIYFPKNSGKIQNTGDMEIEAKKGT